jgi:hypothetical protein
MRRSYPTRPPPVVRAPGCCTTAGASLLSAPLPAERALGAKKRRHKGSARAYERRKVLAKQNPEGGQAKPGRAFGASLARTTAGATLVPLRRASLSLDSESEEPDYHDVSPSNVQTFWTAAIAREGFCRFPTFFIHARSHRGSGRTGEAGAACAPFNGNLRCTAVSARMILYINRKPLIYGSFMSIEYCRVMPCYAHVSVSWTPLRIPHSEV